jgi:hypothetical protein
LMTIMTMERPMAATLTRSGEMTYFSFPIEKAETDPATGDVIVYGKATDGSLDSDEQIIDPDFAAKAIQDWLADGANIRVQHNPQRDPAGVGIEADTDAGGATWVKGRIVEPIAQKLVNAGALRAYSVGIARPHIVRDGTARGGRITGGQVVEISLVDRPANKNCSIQLVKAAKDGHPVHSGMVTGDESFLAKYATATLEKVGPEGYVHGWIKVAPGTGSAMRDTAKKLDGNRTPANAEAAYHLRQAAGTLGDDTRTTDLNMDKAQYHVKAAAMAASAEHQTEIMGHLAKLKEAAQHRETFAGSNLDEKPKKRGLFGGKKTTKGAGMTALAEETVTLELPADVSVAFTPADLARVLQKSKSSNVGEDTHPGGVDRDSLDDSDFAGRHRSFPISSPGDVSDAASSIGRAGDDNYSSDKLKENIKRIAHRKGPEYVAQLPDSWKDGGDDAAEKMEDSDDVIEKAGSSCNLCHGSGKIREGHVTCPRCHGDGKISSGEPDEHGDDQDDSAEKSAPDSKLKKSKKKKRVIADQNDDSDDDDDDSDNDSDNSDDDDGSDSDSDDDSSDDSDDNGSTSKLHRAVVHKACSRCAGTGKRDAGNGHCLRCAGTGTKLTKTEKRHVIAIAKANNWGAWDASHGGSGSTTGGNTAAAASAAFNQAHDTIGDENAPHNVTMKPGEKPTAAELANAHLVHEAHEAHEESLAAKKSVTKGRKITTSAKAPSSPKPSSPKPKATTAKVPEQVMRDAQKSASTEVVKGRKMCVKCSSMMKGKSKFCPECGAAAADGSVPEKTGAKKTGQPQVIKAGERACGGCGKNYHADSDVTKCENCGKRLPPMTSKSASPGDGVTGERTSSIPSHREPDGAMVEAYENDSGMQEGDQNTAPAQPTRLEAPMLKGDMGMMALTRLVKSDAPVNIGILHDLTCAAFSPEMVAKCYPDRSLATTVDVGDWQVKSLNLAASLPYSQAAKAAALGHHAFTLSGSTPLDAWEAHEDLHKAFMDANPGPGTAPTPASITPGQYNRGYISDGHAAVSPAAGPPNSTPITSGEVEAAQFHRGPLTAGQAAPSPGNDPGASAAVSAAINGVMAATNAAAAMNLTGGGMPSTMSLPGASVPSVGKSRTFYSNAGKGKTRAAMQAIHDHISQTFPDLCPMHGEEPAHQPDAQPEANKMPTVPRQLTKSADDGQFTKAERKRQRLAEKAEMFLIKEAAFAQSTLPEPEITKAATVEPEAGNDDLALEMVELREIIKSQGKLLKKQAKALEALSAQPDPGVFAYRGAPLPTPSPYPTITKSSSPAVPGSTMADVAERTKAMMLADLETQFRHSPDPAQREAAWKSILQMRGVG